jgi:hypothetical protein
VTWLQVTGGTVLAGAYVVLALRCLLLVARRQQRRARWKTAVLPEESGARPQHTPKNGIPVRRFTP